MAYQEECQEDTKKDELEPCMDDGTKKADGVPGRVPGGYQERRARTLHGRWHQEGRWRTRKSARRIPRKTSSNPAWTMAPRRPTTYQEECQEDTKKDELEPCMDDGTKK